MKFLLFVVSVLVLLLGLAVSAIARTTIGEIYAAVMMLIAAVLFSGAAIIDAIEQAARKLIERLAPAKERS